MDNAITSRWYSSDAKTVYFGVSLESDKSYFFVVNYAPAAGGGALQTPIAVHFTTGSAFSGHSISGTVHGSVGADPSHALVAMSLKPLNQGDPIFVDGTVADNSGNFTIPYVPDGGYFPLCAKDVNFDGDINPSRGDAIGMGDSLTVSGSDVSDLNLTLMTFPPMGFRTAVHMADSLSQVMLPSDHVLRSVQAYQIDSLGHPGNWEFYYSSTTVDTGYRIELGTFDQRVEFLDSNSSYWFKMMKPITDLASAADPESLVLNAELQGGSAFRHMAHADSLSLQVDLTLGDLRYANFWDLIPDTSSLYWGLSYQYGYQVNQNNWNSVLQKRYLADYSTGSLLVVTGVKDKPAVAPKAVSLEQNYPNPFNPVTTIAFDLPSAANVSLKVYDILGRDMATIFNGERFAAGTHSVQFDASKLPSGMYFFVLEAGSTVSVKKMVLLK
jgi:hypothetical protein